MRLAREAGITATLVAAALAAFAGDEAPRDSERLPAPSGAVARCGEMRGHVGEILAVSFVDADRFATAGEDGTVQFWDTAGAHRAVVALDGRLDRAAFAPGAGSVAYSRGRRVRAIDVDPRAQTRSPGRDADVTATSAPLALAFGVDGDGVFFSDDGGVAASRLARRANRDAIAPLWRAPVSPASAAIAGRRDAELKDQANLCAFVTQSGVRVTNFPAGWPTDFYQSTTDFEPHGKPTTALWLSKDATTIATGAQDGEFALWRLCATEKKRWVSGPPRLLWRAGLKIGRPVSSIVASADGAAIAVTDGARVRICDMAGGAEKLTVTAPADVRAAALSPDHRTLVAACAGGRLVAWDVTADLGAVSGPRPFARRGALPAEIDTFETGSRTGVTIRDTDGTLHVWPPNALAPSTMAPTAAAGTPLALTRDGSGLVRRGPGGTLQLVRYPTGEVVWTAALAAPQRAQFSADGQRIAVLGGDEALHVFTAAGQELFHGIAGRSLWWGGTAAFGTSDAAQPVRFLGADGVERTLVPADVAASCVAATSDGAFAVTFDVAAGLRLFQGGVQRAVMQLPADADTAIPRGVSVAAFGEGGATLVVGTTRGEIIRWDLADVTRNVVLPGHHGPVTGLAFLPRRAQFASCGADGTWILWPCPPVAK